MKNIHWICLALFAFCGVPTFAQDEFREPSVKVGNTVLSRTPVFPKTLPLQ